MAVQQRYKLTKQVPYFGGFIQNLAIKEGVKFSLEFNENDLVFTVFEDELLVREDLFYKLASLIPNTLFLDDIETREVDEEFVEKRLENIEPTEDVKICPQCLKLLFNEMADEYLDTSLVCSHYLEYPLDDEELLDPHLAMLEIEEGHSFSSEIATFTKDPTENILLLNPYIAEDLFVLTEEDKNRLMSLERPSLKVSVFDEVLKEKIGEFASVRVFYDGFTAGLAYVYRDKKDYIFILQ